MRKFILLALLTCCFNGFADEFTMSQSLAGSISIQGKHTGGNYLYVTASPKIYSIGNQKGQFPDVGFHIPGEMGGIWMHPIKLMDGFTLTVDGKELTTGDEFLTFPYATQFIYKQNGLKITRTDFAVDNIPVLVSEWVLSNATNSNQTANVEISLTPHLSPTWLSDRIGIIDGEDKELYFLDGTLMLKDELNDWFSAAKVSGMSVKLLKRSFSHKAKPVYTLQGMVSVGARSSKVLRLFISGSMSSAKAAKDGSEFAMRNLPELFKKKQERYKRIDQTAELSIPDKKLLQAYQWGKYATDWLIRDVAGLGRGLSAGLPDYPWFFSNDQSITFKSIVGTCNPDVMKESIDMLMKSSNTYNHNSGRIIHEMSSNGQVYDKGRMEESQEFIDGAWTLYKWTGDRELLHKIYPQALKIDSFLMANDKDHDFFVEGYGGVEIEGLNDEMFDVACWTARFFRVMSEMSKEMRHPEASETYMAKADTLANRINRLWWCEAENRYYDMQTDSTTALRLIDKALKEWITDDRNLWAKQRMLDLRQQILQGSYKQNGYNIFYNPSTPALTTAVAEYDKARRYLSNVPFFCNKFGLYISGISRPDDITLEEGSVVSRLEGDFNYKQVIMVGATSGLAIAQCMYNGADSSMQYIDKILNNFSFATPGTTYEVCPDYGMFVQAWNVTGLNIPIVQHFFGISPMASHRRIDITPDMPSDWDKASIKNVLIGNNKLSVYYEKTNRRVRITFNSSEAGWKILLHLPNRFDKVSVNGKEGEYPSGVVTVEGNNNTIEYQI